MLRIIYLNTITLFGKSSQQDFWDNTVRAENSKYSRQTSDFDNVWYTVYGLSLGFLSKIHVYILLILLTQCAEGFPQDMSILAFNGYLPAQYSDAIGTF